jgi:hypothetical protein
MSFPDAARQVGKDIAPSFGRAVVAPTPKVETPKVEIPAAWTAKAERCISVSKKKLMENPEVLNWLRLERGLTRETVERFSLGWIPNNEWRDKKDWGLPGDGKKLFFPSGMVIPWENKRIRIRRDDPGEYNGKPNSRYYNVKGSDVAPMTIGNHYENTAIIVESDLDAILLAQEIKRQVFIVAMGSTSYRPDDLLLEKLEECPVVLVALDTDEAGGIAAQWWLDNVSSTYRALTPAAYGKDITAAFLNGLDLNDWLCVAMEIVTEAVVAEAGQQEPGVAPF